MRWLTVLAVLLGSSCDPPAMPTPTTTAPPATAAQQAPYTVTASLWGAAPTSAKYEVRSMESGVPALYDGDGRLLLELMPQLVLDVNQVGSKRPRPATHSFELIGLRPNDGGGFTLLARFKDENGQFDLRIESGAHDPRVHVGLITKWTRDVEVNREVLRFRTGAGLATPTAVDAAMKWAEVTQEWVSPAHSPIAVRFGDSFTLTERHALDGLAMRPAGGGWELELEAYHFANHPIEIGEACGSELDGVGVFSAGDRTEVRADFVLGAVRTPLVRRYPAGANAAVALGDVKEGATRAFEATAVGGPAPTPKPGTWLGASVSELPCATGRFETLHQGGVTAAWAGTEMVSAGANLLAPTETDGRRVFAFSQPGISPVLFALGDSPMSSVWFEPGNLNELGATHGLTAMRAELEPLLGTKLSDGSSVGEAVVREDLWLAGLGEVARRLAALQHVDVEHLPNGVVRVRNNSEFNLNGLTLELPTGVTARLSDGVEYTSDRGLVWFDLAAGADELVQLLQGETPMSTALGVDVTVNYGEAQDTTSAQGGD